MRLYDWWSYGNDGEGSRRGIGAREREAVVVRVVVEVSESGGGEGWRSRGRQSGG
jgi:hypothetical protein